MTGGTLYAILLLDGTGASEATGVVISGKGGFAVVKNFCFVFSRTELLDADEASGVVTFGAVAFGVVTSGFVVSDGRGVSEITTDLLLLLVEEPTL